jgi:hypothetical protein
MDLIVVTVGLNVSNANQILVVRNAVMAHISAILSVCTAHTDVKLVKVI